MTFHWTRRRIVLLASPLLVVVLYVLIGFFGVPAYVRYVLGSIVAQETKGQADIEEVSFNPFTLMLRVNNLRIVDGEGDSVASIDRVRANLQISTLWRNGFVLHELYIEKPHANLIITEGGRFNLAQLMAPMQEQWRPMLVIATVRLVDGEIDYIDRSLPETFEHRVRDIDLTLNDFNLAPAARNLLHFTARTPAGEHIVWDGSFRFDPFSSQGAIKIDPAEPPIYGPYYQRFSRFDISRGRLSMQAQYRFLPMGREPVIDVDVDSIVVEDFKIGRAGSEHDFYRVERGEASKVHVDLVGRTLTIHRIWAKQGVVTIRRAMDGSLPILQAIAATVDGDTNAQANSEDNTELTGLMETLQRILERAQRQAWTVRIDEFEIEGHQIAWIDKGFSEPVELHVSKIDLSGGPVASERQYAFPIRLAAQMDDGSSIELHGKIRPMMPAIDATVLLQNFDLARINPYLERHVPLAVPQGRVTLDGQVELIRPPDQSLQLAYRGNATLENLSVVHRGTPRQPLVRSERVTLTALKGSVSPLKGSLDRLAAAAVSLVESTDGKPIFKAETVSVSDAVAQGEPWQLQAKQVALEKPYLLAGLTSEDRFNLQQWFQAWRGDHSASSGDQADSQPMQMQLGWVQVSNGSGIVFDRRMDEPVTVDFDRFEATLNNVTLEPGEHAQVRVTARLHRDSPLRTDGSIEIGDPGRFADLTINGSGLPMNQYRPYVERYLGYALESGRMKLDVACRLQSHRLDAEAHLILSDFYLGQKVASDHAVDAPVKLALDLLRDRQGQVELTIPIQGNLAEPEFQFAGLIGRAIGGVLAAITTAPFDILASVVSPDEKGIDLRFVSFRPGSAELSAQAVNRLGVLEQALDQRPAVSLRVVGGLAPAADRLPLKRRKFVMKDVPGEIATGVETAADAPAIDPDAPAYRQVIRRHYQQMRQVGSAAAPAGERNAEGGVEPSFEMMEQAVLAGIEVDPQAFRDLARSRLQAVRQHLLKSGRLAAERVELGESSTTATDRPRVIFEVMH